MTRVADTIAAERAQEVWRGFDAPAAEPTVAALRAAIDEGLPGDLTLESIGEWCQPMLVAVTSAPNFFALEQRFYGAMVAGIVLGAKLQETSGT